MGWFGLPRIEIDPFRSEDTTMEQASGQSMVHDVISFIS
jgi:hypothetical protein